MPPVTDAVDDPLRPGSMPPTPVLETERLILRPIRESDVPAIQRIFPQWEVVRFLNARIPWPYPDDGAATNMAECLGKMRSRQMCLWAITLKTAGDELIGRIDLWPDDGKSRDMRGFWLDPELQGRGLMTEAAERVTEFAFVTLGWSHLWLTNAEANVESGRIKEKQGARLIERVATRYVSGPGTRMVWFLDRDEWLARRASLPNP
jgi:ribosomal-protein-alanine N-acetyltransferase